MLGRTSAENHNDLEWTSRNICAELNHFTDLRDTLQVVLRYLGDVTECEAVAIRLHDDGDYPYYVYNGFTDTFIRAENSLCSRDHCGQRIPRADGEGYELDCMCGTILRGIHDTSQPFFTEAGSFWSNHTTALLAETTEEDRDGRTRNRCNSTGYESVALVPIRARNRIMGLLQINDSTIGRFTDDHIEFLESIGQQIGLAVQNSLTHDNLKRTAAELEEKTTQLERSNRELELFAYAASHDLTAPIRTIESFCALLETSLGGDLDPKAQECLRFITQGASRANLLVDRLLEYSRATRHEAHFGLVDLAPLVEEVRVALDTQFEEAGGSLVCAELPPVWGDPVQLSRLFQNLIGNALAYHVPGTRPEVEIDGETDDRGEITVRVADRGVGIPEEHRDLVFEPFRRLRPAGDGGAGLGLFLCQKIITQHGGGISVAPRPGKGSVFTLRFPAPPETSD